MKILHLNGFSDQEREAYRFNVYANILQNIVALLEASQKLELPYSPDLKEAAERIFSLDASQDFSEAGIKQLANDCKVLWKDSNIQQCYARSSEFQINDSAQYFFQNLERISATDYIPNIEDILRIRAKTSGVTEQTFEVNKSTMSVIDVGGQRSERKKWIHCFDNVTAIIFFAALSEYDQKLSEDETTNRMSESLKLFHDITHYKSFTDTPIILFLNKADLFRKKVEKVPLTICWKEYNGKNEFAEATEFIKTKFLEQSPGSPKKQVYAHITVATDTENIKFVFNAVREIIVTAHLKSIGMMVG